MNSTEQPTKGGHPRPGHHPKIVAVTIDGRRHELASGIYTLDALKRELGVPSEYELDEVVHGEFRELDPNKPIHIEGGENFISHVRRGGSS